MENKSKKVICINGDGTKAYEQVIFIMKEGAYLTNLKQPIDFVSEAEKIINGYINKDESIMKNEVNSIFIQEKNGIQQVLFRKSKAKDLMLNTIILICCVSLAIVLLYIQR